MKTLSKWLVLLSLVPILFAACSDSGGDSTGELQLGLTDSPGYYLSVLVTISDIYAVVEGSGPIRLEFADFSSSAVVGETEDSVTVDLIQLSNQEPIEFALGTLPEGKLNQLRLVITEASLSAYEDDVGIDGNDDGFITHDEAVYSVKVPSGEETGIKLNPRGVDIEGGSLTALTLDFDAEKSVVELGNPGSEGYYFILKPVIFILESVGSINVNTETVAVGLNFPTGVEVAEDVGLGSIINEEDVLVANAGTSGTNSNSVVAITPDTVPVDASALAPIISSLDIYGGEPLVNSPTGLAQRMDLLWIANSVSATVSNAGTVTEVYTNGSFSNLFIDNDPPTQSLEGLVATSGIEFGGFAPNGSLSGSEFLVFQTNENGSITGLNLKDSLIFDVLGPGSLAGPTDAAFVPNPTPVAAGDPPGTLLGWLYVTDASANQVVVVSLTTAGGNVGDPGTGIVGAIESTYDFMLLSNPVGIAYSASSDRLYVANRGNGTIIAFQPDGTEIATYNTGLGADSLNGIDVEPDDGDTEDEILVTNTAGNNDPSVDGLGTLEEIEISLL